jgi:CheY-like chemotaxis protein
MILIVEDNPDTSEWYGEIVHSAGYDYEIVTDGVTAVQRAGEQKYRLVLMDWRLPGQSGVMAAAQIRKLPEPYCSVPMIVVTGGMTTQDMDLLPQAGFNAVVQKPFATKRMLSLIKKIARKEIG